MSVLRHGNGFVPQRLSKLYSDTKKTYETAAKSPSSRPSSDSPEIISLQTEFRVQKDRLLAWGIDWSDSNAANPNDIDEIVNQEGFGDVVASVMSVIQRLLMEAGGLRQDVSNGRKKSLDEKRPRKAEWTTEWTELEFSRMRDVLTELSSCIDTLYGLSESRRDLSMSSGIGSSPKGQSRPGLKSKISISSEKSSFFQSFEDIKKSLERQSSDLKRSPSLAGSLKSPNTSATTLQSIPVVVPTPEPAVETAAERPASSHSVSTLHPMYIDQNGLQILTADPSHASNPPPYEAVAASTDTRLIGKLHTLAIPAGVPHLPATDSKVSVVVDFQPMLPEVKESDMHLPETRMQMLSKTLHALSNETRVHHMGVLNFLGYYIDMDARRYAFVYQIPPAMLQTRSLGSSSSLQVPKQETLNSLLQTGEDGVELPVPNLEDRLAIAYQLVLSALHMRNQELIHGHVNSHNILIFPPQTASYEDLATCIRQPFWSSFSQFSADGGRIAEEPLSSNIYRYPDDERNLEDDAAWAYDIYSLGLVLLEVGLWTPVSRLWKTKYNNRVFKSRIENVYVKKLGPKCGTAYIKVVQLLLSAPAFHQATNPSLELANKGFELLPYPGQTEPLDSKAEFPKAFLFTVATMLQRCCAIDIFHPPKAAELDFLPKRAYQHAINKQPTSTSAPELNGTTKKRAGDKTVTQEAGSAHLAAEIKEQNKKSWKRQKCLQKWCNVNIPQHHLDTWNQCLLPRLGSYLNKILLDSQETFAASLTTIGESPETAKTTICVTCSDVSKVRTALRRGFTKKYTRELEGLGLVVVRGETHRSKVPRRRRKKKVTQVTELKSESTSCGVDALNPHYQERPRCGASIGAYRDGQHLPPVSFGGSILVDGEQYGMTVHHMLDSPSDEEDTYDSGDDEMDDEEEEDDDDDDDSELNYSNRDWRDDVSVASSDSASSVLTAIPVSLSISEDEDESDGEEYNEDDYIFSSDDESADDEDSDTVSLGDTAGVDPEEDEPCIVTQPALDDVHEDFFPVAEDRDEDHLSSHSLGYVHASSGVRRWKKDGVKHEIDWALIKFDNERLPARNIVPLRSTKTDDGGSYVPSVAHLTAVTPLLDLPGLEVHCYGRSSGLQRGRISPAMTLVRLRGRQSFSSSFCIEGDLGVPGDSGAWIFDRKNNSVCGHVLAYSEKSCTAYVSPMEVVFEDIQRTLGAREVRLPGQVERPATRSHQNIPSRQSAETAGKPTISSKSQPREVNSPTLTSFARDLSRLDLDSTDRPTRSAGNPSMGAVGSNTSRSQSSSTTDLRRKAKATTPTPFSLSPLVIQTSSPTSSSAKTSSTSTRSSSDPGAPPSSLPTQPGPSSSSDFEQSSTQPNDQERDVSSHIPRPVPNVPPVGKSSSYSVPGNVLLSTAPPQPTNSSNLIRRRHKDVPNSTKAVQYQMQILGRRGGPPGSVGMGRCIERQVA